MSFRLFAMIMGISMLMAFAGCSDDDPVAPKPVLDPSRSTVSVTEAVAGDPVDITVQSMDSKGNPFAQGGAEVTIAVTGANPATPAVTDHGDGTYSATYTPTNPGEDFIAVTMDGTPVEGSPKTSTVRVGDVDGIQSLASVPPGTVGEPSRIEIESRDRAGNPVTHGGAMVAIEIRGANPGMPEVTDHGDGSYSATYTPMSSGTDKVTISMNGKVVTGAPILVPVAHGALDPVHSIAEVPDGMVGEMTEITIEARDVGGNAFEAGGAAVMVSVSGANPRESLEVVDLGDGNYRTSYLPEISGSDFIAVSINGTNLPGSPFESKVGFGMAAAGQTILGLPTGVVGTTGTVTIQTRDAGGNALPSGGARVQIEVSGANPGMLAVMDHGDGTYSADYAPMLAGEDRMWVRVNDVEVPGSPFVIRVQTGAASASKSSVTAVGGNVGETVTVNVQTRDVGGNPLSKGGASIEIEIIGANAGMLPVQDKYNGTYIASYQPVRAGMDEIHVRVGGEPLSGGPVSLAIGVGGPNAAQSTATISGAQVGTATVLYIQARDSGGNPLSKGGAAIQVEITGANPGTPQVQDKHNGTYTATYTPMKAGQDQITVTLGGQALGNSPYTHSVAVGQASAAQTIANVSGDRVGKPVTIYMQARDVGGNSLSKGGAAVGVSVTGANAGTVNVQDKHNGTYVATYTPMRAGFDEVSVNLNGQPLEGSPFSIKVSPGDPDAGRTTANVSGGVLNAMTTIFVQTRDVGGNALSKGGAAIQISVAGANPGTPSIKDNHNGTYLASYMVSSPGIDQVEVTLGGTPISGSPFTVVTNAPTGPVASESEAQVPSGTVGLETEITVVSRDYFGNAVTTGGADVSVAVSGANPASPAVVDNGDGTYSVSYTPMKAGLDQVEILLDGEPVGGGSYTSSIQPGVAAGSMSTANIGGTHAVGGTVSVYVQARDIGGNPLSKGGAEVFVTVSGANQARLTVQDKHNGTYLATYVAEKPGTDNISVIVNDVAVPGTPVQVQIQP